MIPTAIKLNREQGSLSLQYGDGASFSFSGEYLRVHSPSAEVRGHGAGQEVLQSGKKNVKVTAVTKAGNYALQIHFSDGHDSGIYSWEYLRQLGDCHDDNWAAYLEKLKQSGKTREADVQAVKIIDFTKK